VIEWPCLLPSARVSNQAAFPRQACLGVTRVAAIEYKTSLHAADLVVAGGNGFTRQHNANDHREWCRAARGDPSEGHGAREVL
jgi:hypothetical protein